MSDYNSNDLSVLVATAVTALGGVAVAARKWLRSEKVEDARTQTLLGGQRAGDMVVENLVKEVARLTAQMSEMRVELDQLKDRMNTVKMLAMDCFELANVCECEGDTREKLKDHLKSIMRES